MSISHSGYHKHSAYIATHAEQIGVRDQVIAVLVMLVVIDVVPDVVKQCSIRQSSSILGLTANSRSD